MITHRRTYLFLILLLIQSILFACGPNGRASQNDEIKNVFVDKPLDPQTSVLGTEDFPLPNCGGSSVMSQSLGSLASVSNSSTIGATATINGGGDVQVPEVAKLQLQIELSTAYQQTLRNENSRVDTIQLSAEPGTYVIYQVRWEQLTYSSTISYAVGNQVYKVPYEFMLRVPKNNRSDQLPCTGGGITTSASPEPTPQTSTNIIQTTFEVFANLSWQDSGVEIGPNDKLRIIWDGQSKWVGAPGNPTDPLGGWVDPNPGYACSPQVDPSEAGSSALVAKIGEFGLPTNPFKQIPTGSGNLFFTMNDCDSQRFDNSGSITVTIEITR